MSTSHERLLWMAVSALAAVFSSAAVSQPAADGPSHRFAQSTPIAGRYIVIFRSSATEAAAEAANVVRAAGPGARLHHVYTAAIKGFAATLPESALAALRNNPLVQSIEQDQTVSLSSVSGTETNATWGLDRVDQRFLQLDYSYHYNGTGLGVTAFIIDTGIRSDHEDFEGRAASAGFTSISDGRGTNDCNGHGTHVSGTVGGQKWGVAKDVKLVPVRVLDCRGSGTWSGVIAGIDYVAGTSADVTMRPAVANMSLGGGKSASVNSAVAGAVASGVTMVVAAGNSTADACNYSPASEPSAVTVGATTNGDARASYSNFGACVDIFAPGSSITSAWYTSSTATNTISGTSMASPHVTGVAALVAEANPNATPGAISSFLISNATTGQLTSIGTGSPNLLLYSLADGTATATADITIGIDSLSGTGTKAGRNWRGKATVTVKNVNNSAAVANVTVTGSFVPGGVATCVTGGSGSCTLTSAPIEPAVPSTNISVTDLSGSKMAFDEQQAQITILRP